MTVLHTYIFSQLKYATSPIKRKLSQKYSQLRYISSHREAKFRPVKDAETRLNIVLPSINANEVFGGATTALYFAFALRHKLDCPLNIYTFNPIRDCCELIQNEMKKLPGYVMTRQIDIGESLIDVGKNDIYIATYWTTALFIEKVVRFQRKTWSDTFWPIIYLIQDYEPGFYPWSTEYYEAERSYRLSINTIAVINSGELERYFKLRGYSFAGMVSFPPVLNVGLKKKLINLSTSVQPSRKKQVLIYGRPTEQRNAFSLVVEALKQTSILMGDDAKQWRFLSLGEKHQKIRLHNGAFLESRGKVSIDAYAEIMAESYAGVSLMISPHPSYPPLEMSTFGVRTITNCFECKDLSNFNENIVSLDRYDAASIAEKLVQLLREWEPGSIQLDTNYVRRDNPLDAAVDYCFCCLKGKHGRKSTGF